MTSVSLNQETGRKEVILAESLDLVLGGGRLYHRRQGEKKLWHTGYPVRVS